MTVLFNLLITGPLLTLVSDAIETTIRTSLIKDLRELEPVFKKYFVEMAGDGKDSEGEGASAPTHKNGCTATR